jgi:hypothetical protein
MAGSPVWKVYDSAGVYQAACKEVEAAAVLVSFYGEGSSIRHSHDVTVWTEGKESQPAHVSYDLVAALAKSRVRSRHERGYIRAHGHLPKGYQS